MRNVILASFIENERLSSLDLISSKTNEFIEQLKSKLRSDKLNLTVLGAVFPILLGHRWQDWPSGGLMCNGTRASARSIFGQLQMNGKNSGITGGISYDRNENFNGRTNLGEMELFPTVRGCLLLVSARALASTLFRRPTYKQRIRWS